MKNAMFHLLKYTFPVWLLAAWSCNKSSVGNPPAPTPGTTPITWDVVDVGTPGAESRSLIGPDKDSEGNPYVDPDWVTIEHACTSDAEGGEGKAIGIWADYTYMDTDGMETTIKDLFQGTRLIYETGSGTNRWDYEGEDLYWLMGGKYKFRAYFPQELNQYVVSSTNATTFVIQYPTHQVQEDLLLAYNATDTNDPQTDLNDPVELRLKHGLAALRFRIKANFANSDELTSCYLQNSDTRDFATSGMLAYGSEANEESISWVMGYYPPVTERIYYWSNDGIPFSTDDTGNATAAMAYSQTGATAGEMYTQNNGWVLILPQPSSGNLRFCFTTKQGDKAIYSVTIPKVTERTDNGDGTFTESTDYLPGKRYTYTITISRTDVELTLSVADWNERDSSHSIIF